MTDNLFFFTIKEKDMIKNEINKILFLDIETVGICKNTQCFKRDYPELYDVWELSGYDYFSRHYPEDSTLTPSEVFEKRSGLLPEFGRIVCVSVGFVTPKGENKFESYIGDEIEILEKTKTLLDRVDKLGFTLCGHNIKTFDLPYIAKRMLINGISVPKIIPDFNTKPWDANVIDTKELWNFNSFKGLSSLQLVTASMGLKNPKMGEVKGENLHKYFYNDGDIKKIEEYCVGDVESTINLVKKIKEIYGE